MRYVVLSLLFISSLFAFNVQILDAEVANGKTALLEFKKEKDFEYKNVIK